MEINAHGRTYTGTLREIEDQLDTEENQTRYNQYTRPPYWTTPVVAIIMAILIMVVTYAVTQK